MFVNIENTIKFTLTLCTNVRGKKLNKTNNSKR